MTRAALSLVALLTVHAFATPAHFFSLHRVQIPKMWWYSEWGMRGWSVLGSVLLMGSGALVWSLLMARWIDSKAYTLFPLHGTLKDRQHRPLAHGSAGQNK